MKEYSFYEDFRHEYDGWDDAPADPAAPNAGVTAAEARFRKEFENGN